MTMAAAVTNKDILEAVANDDGAVKFQKFVEELGVPVNKTYYEAAEGTAAHIAANYGNLGIVKYVLEKDPFILTTPDGGGNTILFIAIEKGHIDIVKYLVEKHDSKISEKSERANGNTAIHHAAENGQLAILKYFIEELNQDVNILNNFKQPPVFVAALKMHYPVVMYLVEERHADLTLLDHKNENILFMAVHADDISVMKYILDKQKINIDLNQKNILGDTIVSQAALLDRQRILQYLVGEKKADVNIADDWGKTALHTAARKNNFQVCKYLLQQGANINAKGVDGKLPVDEATNARIKTLFENQAKNRERRSVSNFLHPSEAGDIERAYTLIWDMKENSRVTNRLDGRSRVHSVASDHNHKGSFEILSFLVIANMVKSKTHKYHPPKRIVSPQELLRNRMDPFAVNAILKFHENN